MEEFIGFGLLALMVVIGGLGIKRLFKPKKDFFEYEDEIILDEKMLFLTSLEAKIGSTDLMIAKSTK